MVNLTSNLGTSSDISDIDHLIEQQPRPVVEQLRICLWISPKLKSLRAPRPRQVILA